MERSHFSRPLTLKNVTIKDGFWSPKQELVRKEVIPYQWDALNDKVEGAAPSYCMHNFKAAARLNERLKNGQVDENGQKYEAPQYTFRGFEALPEDPGNPDPDKFYGFVFQDTDFSKWVEAVGYSLIRYPDPELEKTADDAIDIVCAAQLDNGYLDTYYILNGMDRSFTNLRDHHELYCLGHLIEGAISYYEATGKDKLLNAAKRFADYVREYFGIEEGKCKGYPGHEIAEMALSRLYEVTGEEKYLELAEYFIDERGREPLYFDIEEKERVTHDGGVYKTPVIRADSNWFERNRGWYHQADKPVRKQDEAVGHAVRAVYLYSGMADVARLSNDDTLYEACKKLWDSIVNTKMYVTGGIGATHMGEAFSFPYDLPNDTAYSETCAAIGLVFFARRMLEIEADVRPKLQLQKLKDVRIVSPYESIPFDPHKLSISLFVAEFLYYALRGEQYNIPLYDYIASSFLWLDTQNVRFANFHLVFLMRMSRFLGFYPNVEHYVSGNYFDLRESVFCAQPPVHRDFLFPHEAEKIQLMLRMDYPTMHLFKMSHEERGRLIEVVLRYYRLHLPDFPDLKSLDVLRELYL